MKSYKQLFTGLLLVSIYCIGVLSTTPNTTSFIPKYSSIAVKDNTPVLNAHSLQHLSGGEISFNSGSIPAISNSNGSGSKIVDGLFVVQLHLKNSFVQYYAYFKNLRIAYRKSTLMFPFHSFW